MSTGPVILAFSGGLDTSFCQQGSKGSGVLGIAINDQQLLICQEPLDGVGEIPTDLHHPLFTWTGRDSCDVDATRRKLDHEEDVESHETTRCPNP